MISGKTKSGFKFSIDERIINDWRFATALGEVQKGPAQDKLKAASDMLHLLLGDEQVTALENHIMKKNDGFCPTEAIFEEVTEILTKSKELKN